jgi:hypothetical protein
MQREIVIEYPRPPAPARPLTRVRSTIVTSALSALRERGHLDRYLAALDPTNRELIVTTVAGTWLPLDLVMTHYVACESLGLSNDECFAIGSAVGSRMHESVLHLVRSLASGVGVTPWNAAARYDSFWTRLFDGGGFRLTKVGPKEGLTEFFQLPIARFAYFRSAFCGVSQVGTSLFTSKAYVRVVATTKDGFTIRSSWV